MQPLKVKSSAAENYKYHQCMYKIEEYVNWILDIKIDQNIDIFWSLKTPSIAMDNKFTHTERIFKKINESTNC